MLTAGLLSIHVGLLAKRLARFGFPTTSGSEECFRWSHPLFDYI